jgi:enoyl-CoA hydratase/carnithine racemase
VVPHERLMEEARALAGRIAANPPLAVQALKTGLARTAYGDPREIGGWAIDTIRRLARTDDHLEGVASYLEKRAPVFKEPRVQCVRATGPSPTSSRLGACGVT